MAITFKPRIVKIEPRVIELYREVCDRKVRQLEQERRAMNSHMQAQFDREMGAIIEDAKGIAAGNAAALDDFATRISKVQLAEIRIVETGGEPYFVGQTRDLVMKDERGNKWDAGDYLLGLSAEAFVEGYLGGLHFIPIRNIHGWARHPHHHVRNSWDYDRDRLMVSNPLEAETSNCWGGFADALGTMLISLDIVNVFGIMQHFAGSYNTASPLVGLVDLEHIRRLS